MSTNQKQIHIICLVNDLIALIGLAIAGSVVALVGGLAFLYIKGWSSWLSKYSIPFAAGVLLTVTLVGLMPEAAELYGEEAFVIVLVAFVGSYFFENYFTQLHHHDDSHGMKSSVALVVVGDTIHNLVDGITIAAAYLISPGLGVITTVSTFLHEVPHEVGDFGLMLKAGWQRRNIIVVNLISAFATVLGAVLVFWLAPSEAVLGVLIAVAAGMFLYLGASDFLPNIQNGDTPKHKVMAAFLAGIVLMYLSTILVPHSH